MNPPAPFTASFSPNVPELLWQLNCTLALSTYQAGKIVFLSAADSERMHQLPRTFPHAMGVALKNDKMAIACKSELIILKNVEGLAVNYPPKPNTYDALFMPRQTFHTGQLALHDMAWTENGLTAINTLFSCISIFDEEFSFRPIWQPKFITQLAPEDRCHLNGMATLNNKIKYVSALGVADTFHGWREKKLTGGILIDVPSNEIILENLPMPHSPRIYDGKTYLLLSAAGELVEVDTQNGNYKTVVKTPYFIRGMDKYGDYLFIGHSKLRHNSSAFKDLPIAEKSINAGVLIIHLPTASIAGYIRYQSSVDEIYDVKVLPGIRRANILSAEKEESTMAVITPTDTYWAVKQEKGTNPITDN